MTTQKEAETAAAEFGLSDALPEGWRPTEGSVLIGNVVGLTKGWSDYQQSFYPIVIVHDELSGKDIAVHGFHFVMMDRLTALRPQVGERIGFKMGPKVPLKSNPKQSVQTYTVKIEGRTEDIWDDIQSPRANAPAAQAQARVTDVETGDSDEIPF